MSGGVGSTASGMISSDAESACTIALVANRWGMGESAVVGPLSRTVRRTPFTDRVRAVGMKQVYRG